MATSLSTLKPGTPDNTFRWLLHASAEDFSSRRRMGLGNGTDSGLALTATTVGVVNAGGFVADFNATALTADRAIAVPNAGGTLVLGDGTGITNAGAFRTALGVGTANSPVFAGLSTLAGHITLSANNTWDLGSSSTGWRNVYAATGFHVATGQFYNIVGVGTISGAANGVFRLKNVAGDAGVGSWCFGSDTSASVRLKANGTEIQVRNGDDTAWGSLATGRASFKSSENHFVRVVTAAGAVTVSTTDYIVVVNKSSGEATAVNLPASPTAGDVYIVKDGKGDAAANNITITPAAGNIDGAATLVMATNYQSSRLVYNGTQWNVI